MRVLVDTPVWSEFLRRQSPNKETRDSMRRIVEDGSAILLGHVRQEILSGIKDPKQFDRLMHALRAFVDEPVITVDFEVAATMCNKCRAKGIQGSNTDYLICSVAARLSVPVFTLDRDFEAFAPVVGIRLFDAAV